MTSSIGERFSRGSSMEVGRPAARSQSGAEVFCATIGQERCGSSGTVIRRAVVLTSDVIVLSTSVSAATRPC